MRRLGDAPATREAVGGDPQRDARATRAGPRSRRRRSTTISCRRSFTSSSVQKNSWRPCTHSKYETTTPPAFASTSGTTSTPFASRISSAAGVVGPFAPSSTISRLDAVGVRLGDHLLERARREHVAPKLEQLLVRDRARRRRSRRSGRPRACARAAAATSSPSGSWRPPVESETATTFAPASAANRANSEPTLPKPWTATFRPSSVSPAPRQRLLQAEEDAAPGRLVAAERAADRERLAGDDAEHRVALVHRVRVEDPRHHRRARADVGRRDVLLRPDLVDDLGRVAARHPLELADRERLRVADDAALRAAERQVHQRALPGHPHRERLDLVERDGRVVADAALRRAAGDVVRDAPAGEDAHGAVVHRGRDRDLDRLLALAEDRRPGRRRSRRRSATFWSCCCAILKGLSVVDRHGSLRSYCIRKADLLPAGRAGQRRPGDEADLVARRAGGRPRSGRGR